METNVIELHNRFDFFKILGDSTRVSILFAIDGEPMCVCDIANLLGMPKSAVSHQLKILRQSDLVTYRKSGKNVFYSLADDHVRDIIEKEKAAINRVEELEKRESITYGFSEKYRKNMKQRLKELMNWKSIKIN